MSLPPAEIAKQEATLHANRQTGLTVVYVVGLVVSTIAVALRFFARRISNTALKADDWTVVLALVLQLLLDIRASLSLTRCYLGLLLCAHWHWDLSQ